MALNTLVSTTLSSAVAVGDSVWNLASATGLSFSSPTLLFCDGEVCELEVGPGQTTPGTAAYVGRMKNRQAHASGATVYIGRPEWFKITDASGADTLATTFVHPWINTRNGNIFQIVSGVWTIANSFSPYVTDVVTTQHIGAAATGVTATEYGTSRSHSTSLTFSGLSMAATTNAAKAMGVALYTLPAGNISFKVSYMSVGVIGTGVLNAANTPDVGVGTLIGSGANATLNAVGAACHNVIPHQTAADANNTPTVITSATSLAVQTADSHIVYFNAAASWAGIDSMMKASGTVVIDWDFLA